MISINEVKVGDKVKFIPPENSLEIEGNQLQPNDILEICEINQGGWLSANAEQKQFYQSSIKTVRVNGFNESVNIFVGEQGFSYLEKI